MVLCTATEDEDVPGPRTLIMVAPVLKALYGSPTILTKISMAITKRGHERQRPLLFAK
jgi:hypothetical protein